MSPRQDLQVQPLNVSMIENLIEPNTPYNPPAQAAPAAVSDWRSRAKPVTSEPAVKAGSWKDRATPVTTAAQPAPEPTFTERVQGHVDERQKQMQGSADAYVAGEQSLPETMAQQGLAFAGVVPDTIGEALSSVTPQVVKDVGAGAMNLIGKLPTNVPSAPTVGDVAANTGKYLSDVAEAHPRLARNVQAGADALSVAGAGYGIKSAVNVADQLGSKALSAPVVKNYLQDERTAAGVKATTPKPTTADDLGKAAGESYDEAAYLGAKFTPEQVSNRLGDELNRAVPKPIAGKVLTSEDKVFMDNLKEYAGLKGQNLSLDDIKRLDETLSAKITSKFIDAKTGAPDANGRRLIQFQHKIRQIVDEVNEPGNDALVNGRTLWAAKRRLDDLDAIAERASMAQGDKAKALQQGYKRLYLDKDAMRGWPDDAKALLKKAGTPGLSDKALSLITTRLPAMIGLGTGNVAGAATLHTVGAAGRGVKDAIVAKRGARVQQSVVDSAMSKVRPVDIPEPTVDVPLQLAAPGKLSPLGMDDKQVNIAQKLMSKDAAKVSNDSGVAIKPPVSQLGKLQATLGRKRGKEFSDTVQIFKDGDMSQNQFVKDVTSKFGLNTKQARDLAKEVKTYGVPEVAKTPGKLKIEPLPDLTQDISDYPKPNVTKDQVTLYHVTDNEAADNILKEGFKAASPNQFQGFESHVQGVYGWSSKERAALELQRIQDAGDDASHYSIIELKLPRKEFEGKMRPDEDSGTDDWLNSLSEAASASVEGDIPAKYITKLYRSK